MKNNQPRITTLGMSKSLRPNTAERKLAEHKPEKLGTGITQMYSI